MEEGKEPGSIRALGPDERHAGRNWGGLVVGGTYAGIGRIGTWGRGSSGLDGQHTAPMMGGARILDGLG